MSLYAKLPDEAIIAINDFLEEFYTRFKNHYFPQMHRSTTTGLIKTPTSSP